MGELGEGEMKALEMDDRTVVLLNVNGDFYAMDDECTHQGCPLSGDELEGEILIGFSRSIERDYASSSW